MHNEVVSSTFRHGSLPLANPFLLPFLVLMADPNWNRGFYYEGLPPHTGMKLARRTSFYHYISFLAFMPRPYSYFFLDFRDSYDHLPLRTRMGSTVRSECTGGVA